MTRAETLTCDKCNMPIDTSPVPNVGINYYEVQPVPFTHGGSVHAVYVSPEVFNTKHYHTKCLFSNVVLEQKVIQRINELGDGTIDTYIKDELQNLLAK